METPIGDVTISKGAVPTDDWRIRIGDAPVGFNFSGAKNELLFRITPDGTIERGPGFTTEDEMSLRFWDAVAEVMPQWKRALLEEASV